MAQSFDLGEEIRSAKVPATRITRSRRLIAQNNVDIVRLATGSTAQRQPDRRAGRALSHGHLASNFGTPRP